MKIELTHIIDEQNQEWYLVEKAGVKKWFSVLQNGSNRDEKLQEATTYYNLAKEARDPQVVVILSEEIN